MSDPTPAPKLQTFYVYAPDKKEDGVLDKRFSVRSQHLERISGLISSKVIRLSRHHLNFVTSPADLDPRFWGRATRS